MTQPCLLVSRSVACLYERLAVHRIKKVLYEPMCKRSHCAFVFSHAFQYFVAVTIAGCLGPCCIHICTLQLAYI